MEFSLPETWTGGRKKCARTHLSNDRLWRSVIQVLYCCIVGASFMCCIVEVIVEIILQSNAVTAAPSHTETSDATYKAPRNIKVIEDGILLQIAV